MADRIPLGPGTVVDGDVFVGVGGDPKTVIGAGGTITGEKYALPTEPEFPVITAPALPDMGTSLYAKGATLTIGPADSGKYTGVTLAQGSSSSGVVEISGGDVVLHITGNIDLGTGCEFIVRPGSSLTLYVDGNIYTANSAGFSNENTDIAKLQLYATGGSEQIFDLKAKSKIFGVVYAPDVDISAYPSTELHGSITGNSVTMKSGCTFYYDEALRNGSLYNEGVRVVVKRWWEE